MRPIVNKERSITGVVQVQRSRHSEIRYTQLYRCQFNKELDRIEYEGSDPCRIHHFWQRFENYLCFFCGHAAIEFYSAGSLELAHFGPVCIHIIVFVARNAWQTMSTRRI